MNLRVAADYLTPVAVCMFVSLGFVRLFMLSGLGLSLPKTLAGSFFDQLVWTLALTALGLLGVTCLYWLIARRRDFELRVLVAIVVAPTSAIVVIILSQTVLLVLAKTVSSFMTSLIVLASLYVAVFSVIFILSDAFSTRVRNFVFTLYGAILGSFVSLLLPTTSLIVLLIGVALYDLVILSSSWIAAAIKDLSLSKGISSRFAYVGGGVEIGIGELIFYSFVPAHVEAYYGMPLLILTLIMTVLGVLLNLWTLAKRGFLAGLPAPIFLGLIPMVLSLVL